MGIFTEEPIINIRHQKLIQKCCDILSESLKSDQNIPLPDLAAHITTAHARHPLPEVITSIIKAEMPPSKILNALMQCQSMILEQKLPELLNLPSDEQIKELKCIFEHFNYIETSIIELGEEFWVTKNKKGQKNLETERESRILAISSQQWKAADTIKILNYYKGLPIQSINKIIDITVDPTEDLKRTITVQASGALERVLAISEKNCVLTPDSEDIVFIKMEVLNKTSGKATFYIKGLVPMERRNHLRLQPLSEVSINLYRNKTSVGCGKILDLSLSHIAATIPYPDTHPFKKDEIIDFHFQLDQDNIKGAGWARSVRQDRNCLIVCIEIMPDTTIQKQLQLEIATLQRKIIKEIRLKCNFGS
ncbi:MAG: hypothetical protein R8K22_04140 [Mariprofundaceae bacterium]